MKFVIHPEKPDWKNNHCVKYPRIQVLADSHFPVYAILSLYEEMRVSQNPYFCIFYAVNSSVITQKDNLKMEVTRKQSTPNFS